MIWILQNGETNAELWGNLEGMEQSHSFSHFLSVLISNGGFQGPLWLTGDWCVNLTQVQIYADMRIFSSF